MTSLIEQFFRSTPIAGGNADYVEALYEHWLADPDSVDAAWQTYFAELKGREAGDIPRSVILDRIAEAAKHAGRVNGDGPVDDEQARRQGAVLKLVTAYRSRGHLHADIDPLDLMQHPPAPDLDLPFHGLASSDLDTEFSTGSYSGATRMTLKALLGKLKATYSGSIGAEFMHITDAEQRRWVYERLEQAAGDYGLSAAEKKRALESLTAAEGLERFLHTKYVGQKRFSLEGGDSLIPLMDEMVRRCGANQVREMVVGMAHRGRLNVLINTMGKPSRQLFAEFEGRHEGPHDPAHSGDVKYHMGFSSDVVTPDGPVHLALGFNPSHLEIIDPVIAGSVRARQTRRGDAERRQVLPLLIHGDAAFAGQGVVMELLQMSQARGFAVGGTVHVVINNQVGFTTSRTDDARSTLYCTDVAKMVGAPILHVNGDDPEAVLFCTRLAFDFRQRFHRDVVIDLVCYRRHGHNEADEPAATQPLMYQHIRKHKTPRELYAGKLEQSGVLGADEAKAMVDRYRDRMDAGEGVVELVVDPKDDFAVDWSPYLDGKLGDAVDTAVNAETLKSLADTIINVPENVKLHARVARIYEDRAKMAEGEIPMDWGFAENLAYATLVADGSKLRLVGQDSGRGTFFHRHAVLHDQKTGATDMPLRRLAKRPEDVTIIDSLLSEEAVMGFEYGYATADPTTLNIWEGQFGDFANGAQVVIDQFISSGEAKWGRLCGLALFLPHGYEGQGPEHSSARLERFLQLCALDNMQVCMPTTPAQMFHMIRRQMLYRIRKPLIVMMPKSMLRNKRSVSSLAELSRGGFQNLIPDSTSKAGKPVRRVVACAGKVYYDLLEEAENRGITDVAIVRVEQLYPFPRPALIEELQRFPAAKELVWCQEEPMNQGAWYQIQHHLRYCAQEGQSVHYAGRERSPAPACGHFGTHQAEQAQLVEDALVGELNGDSPAD
ncbi:MAG: 2-oxoglutarate dehydrogenase E1 component [Rhodanobacteraceae bacterium]|nr:2-oxoglutarate dehydrogenase E1 component [Rhodanobacteraceae bacterium]HRY01269.1 2-oxoglutarate dehydrogenase E1 component [Xanthomonadaceae bacterium]